MSSRPEAIRLRGVRQNNLKNLDLDLPLGKLIVVTGLSGAGKSSLVFETLHAEGQRRYVETFSPYARQFMERLERPQVDSLENIRPSIAIEQGNTVKTSRSTVGTITELTDYFKVWFSHVAELHDPANGERVVEGHPATAWAYAREAQAGKTLLVAFPVHRPEKLSWEEIGRSLIAQGYSRVVCAGALQKLEEVDLAKLPREAEILVIQDRVAVEASQQARFVEAARTAFHYGQGQLRLLSEKGKTLRTVFEGLRSPVTGQVFRAATPALFSFNSPVGACPKCRGFGRVIEIDYRLVIPDQRLSLKEGAIRAFQGAVYSESQRDMLKAAKEHGIPVDRPWRDLTPEQQGLVIEGEPGYGVGERKWPQAWYGVRRFFEWLESNTYKMHVRVFLSKYRAYVECPACAGTRLVPEARYWHWRGSTLPELYQLPVAELLPLLQEHPLPTGPQGLVSAQEAILTRLSYLHEVGLGYLTLDRSSRSLSGGETQRVNLTTCLGTSLVDTLFVLDEPSIGLHPRDIHRLTRVLRQLTDNGNTVVVVEHDEAIMRAADLLVEMGPQPGAAGGQVTFLGTRQELESRPDSLTGAYLSGRLDIDIPTRRRPVRKQRDQKWLRVRGARKHNLHGLDVDIPLQRLVVLGGVSGSGKSTLLNNVLHQGWLAQSGRATEDPAELTSLESDIGFSEVVMVDQSPVSRTPRSNPALFVEAWDDIRQLFAQTEEARAQGHGAGSFSFNSGPGRCETCEGLGHERIEMQFMADVYVPCSACEGKRFKPEILAIHWQGKSVEEVLRLTVDEALDFFKDKARLRRRLETLTAVGLGYLTLGQPLNTLSGGESQRLKLVKYLGRFDRSVANALLLLDEPTTGLHRDDIRRLLGVLQQLVEAGHSLVLIEHQLDVLKSADWLIELGPEAGAGGGELVFAGTPEELVAQGKSATAPFLRLEMAPRDEVQPLAAEELPVPVAPERHRPEGLHIMGARTHNLKNLDLHLPHYAMTVVTGVSGSGKSSLAFDLVFAEGQRRFMESMSAWARQYVEQLPRPELDRLTGIPPTVAIEQRTTRGSRKSTVATITEVAQYLRLLYARLGVPHSPKTGQPLVSLSEQKLRRSLEERALDLLEKGRPLLYLCAPLVRGRKGHHEPLANWAREHGYHQLRIDGRLVPLSSFKRLDRYREHDIELVVADLLRTGKNLAVRGADKGLNLKEALATALKLGKSAAFLAGPDGEHLGWFSTERTDPETGEAFPSLDPKHFSWHSSQGWCPTCRGNGVLLELDEETTEAEEETSTTGEPGEVCPDCQGSRLNARARSVYLHRKDAPPINLPDLLSLPAPQVLEVLAELKLDRRGQAILAQVRPEIVERLNFLGDIGLSYLSLDRATNTLSGGEAQRIRLAAQLGSNLSGVLYVLDEPSIGLHARDNARLLASLQTLKAKGNTLLVVEHDLETMRAADWIVDLGPGAGRHGGEVLAAGTLATIAASPRSLTARFLKEGMRHPRRGAYRPLPEPYHPRRKTAEQDWLVLDEPSLRNLKGGQLRLPKGRLIAVCGISGAGKSTLVRDLLKPAVQAAIERRSSRLEGRSSGMPFASLRGAQLYRSVIEVDQSAIGKTPRSTPATYLGAFDLIRQYYGQLPEARLRGYTPSTFSFNTKGGRCETCKGAGRLKLEMSFMPETYLDCEDCGGSRYAPELADLCWNGKNIADVLAMTFEEATEFFAFQARLHGMLKLMNDTGLGYLTLGQSSPTLSGGEAQRLKLVTELSKGLQSVRERARGTQPQNLYILEEPTIGLHPRDCERLIDVLHALVDQGHTVVLIEHHLDLLAEADYLVELGPEGGAAGGEILYQGSVSGLLDRPGSPTAPFLRPLLD